MKTTKVMVFASGNSQAVRLPKGFDFSKGGEVYLRRDEQTGDVLISRHPGAEAWSVYFALVKGVDPVPKSVLARPLNRPVEGQPSKGRK